MKGKSKQIFRSMLSLLLVMCMVISASPINALAAQNDEEAIVYVSLGDSMTNGYCLEGYEGNSGGINYGTSSYANKVAAWLAGYKGTVENDQVIFEGANGTVDHRPLAISGMRAQDIQWALELDYDNDTLMKNVFSMDYDGSGWSESKWYDDFKFAGDRTTWADFCDYDYRYADAAAKILAVYNTGENDKYFASSYANESSVNSAINGLKANDYFPEGKDQINSIGGYKYIQIASEYYQKSVADADVISLAVGNTNFGTFMLQSITDLIMYNNTNFANNYKYDRVIAQAPNGSFARTKIDEMFASSAYTNMVKALQSLAGDDAAKVSAIEYIVKYAMASYIVGYVGVLEAILKVNPDAEIIQIALMNAYKKNDGTIEKGTLSELVEMIYTPVNDLIKKLPAQLLASKTKEEQEKYKEANFYFAEAGYVSCMVDEFGDDFYKKNGNFVSYPNLLNGTEGYTANEDSIVRARFVEEIVCGTMIFAAMGLQKPTSEIPSFLEGVIAYDMMTPVQKAAYAANNADKAKEYALYLGFENAIIRSGTESVTVEAFANLANFQSQFAEFQGPLMGEIGTQSTNYYDEAAVVVAAGSNGLVSEDQVVQIMAAYEQMKAGVWNAYAAAHESLKQIKHKSINHILNCETCLKGNDHGTQAILATYNEQLELLPYTIIASTAKQQMGIQEGDQLGDLLTGEVVKSFCEAPNYKEAVYAFVIDLASEKFGYDITSEQIDLLLEEDGAFKVAGALVGQDAALVKLAYQNNLLDADQKEKIELLIKVRAAVIALLDNENTFKTTAAGIPTVIENASKAAYLLAIPQTMSDELYADSNMRGALCMNARCLLGTGAGGHPSATGHKTLYNAIIATDFAKNWHIHSIDTIWNWTEDYSKATATRKCIVDGCDYVIETVDATIESEETKATCDEDGKVVYTATAVIAGQKDTDVKEVVEKASGHTYAEEAVFVWSEDYKTATATLACTNEDCD